MTLKIKNWKLTLLALIFIGVFTGLGNWQLSRAKQKETLLKHFAERTARAPLTAQVLNQSEDRRFYRAQLNGTFDNEHTLLLDNKTHQGKVGYEVYTPFKAKGLTASILVDRGFVPIGKTRKVLPVLQTISGNITILGMLNLPPAYVALGQIKEPSQTSWPLRIEFVDLAQLSTLLGRPLCPYTLSIAPKGPAAYEIEWQAVTLPPERHKGYAVQWFALAFTLLILCVVLNRGRPL